MDEIATISGFRLGRTQRVDVPVEEINAALGQVVYLLCVQAHHLGYVFDKYYLHAQGAFSKISTMNDRNTKFDFNKQFAPPGLEPKRNTAVDSKPLGRPKNLTAEQEAKQRKEWYEKMIW